MEPAWDFLSFSFCSSHRAFSPLKKTKTKTKTDAWPGSYLQRFWLS